MSIIDHEGKRLVATGSSMAKSWSWTGRRDRRACGIKETKDGSHREDALLQGHPPEDHHGHSLSSRFGRLVVVSCSNDSTCEVYDVFDGEEVANMTYHAGCVNCLEVSVISSEELVGEAGGPDVLLTGGADGTAKLWGLGRTTCVCGPTRVIVVVCVGCVLVVSMGGTLWSRVRWIKSAGLLCFDRRNHIRPAGRVLLLFLHLL